MERGPIQNSSNVYFVYLVGQKGPCKLLKTIQTTRTMTKKIAITSNTVRWPPTLGRLSATIAPSHVPQEFKDTIFHELSRHYELSNFNANQLQYINNLCSSRFTQWKSDLHKHYELYDGPEVALEVGCPIELVDRRDEWEWLYDHFQDEEYLFVGQTCMSITQEFVGRTRMSVVQEFWGSNPCFVVRYTQLPPIPALCNRICATLSSPPNVSGDGFFLCTTLSPSSPKKLFLVVSTPNA
ncbi:hypothetical protein D8674_037466 [Pyrus ussuriensis x Pyrus communis]|uniref:Uncharacterized protein n=1 Tax=Pyrus ussuriensis x Pyrus communis TaxID=2448454 RepID=A0A5N5H3I6_9ROSA|nr:hypothetical protein D8674_037466 [Pyrus ussuriensis x Pyrus communis]